MLRVKELEEQTTKLQEEKSKMHLEERKAALSDFLEKIVLFEIAVQELGFKVVDGGEFRKKEKSVPRRPLRRWLGRPLGCRPPRVGPTSILMVKKSPSDVVSRLRRLQPMRWSMASPR